MRLHTLERSMAVLRPTTPGKGMCFHWSAALILDLESYDGAELCIGILHDNLIHAWVEYEEFVYAPTLILVLGKLLPVPVSLYYAENKVRDVKRLTREQVVSLGAYQHLTTGHPLPDGRALGDDLMRLAGIEWIKTQQGTAVARPE